MRKKIVDNTEVIIDNPKDRHKSRNVPGDVVAKRNEKLKKLIEKFNAK